MPQFSVAANQCCKSRCDSLYLIRYNANPARQEPTMSSLPIQAGLLALAMLASSPAARAEPARPAAPACKVGAWDMRTERSLFEGTARLVTAAASQNGVLPELPLQHLVELALIDHRHIEFAAPLRRQQPSGASFAGMAAFTVPTAGRYRITMDGPLWVDVVAAGGALKATAFGGTRTCPLFRKSVEFELPADVRLLLQLHGSGRDSVRLSIVRSDGYRGDQQTR